MKDDLYERLKRLNKGQLADQIVRGRELVDKGSSGKDPVPHTSKRSETPLEKETPGTRSGRNRLRDDMIRPVRGSESPIRSSASRPGSCRGEFEGLRQVEKPKPVNAEGGSNASVARGRPTPSGPAGSWEALRNEIEGELRETPVGACLVRRTEFRTGEWAGSQQIPEPEAVQMVLIAQLARDERFASLEPTDLLFLDTETTGLAGGTGTVAFLVGIGHWTDGRFGVEQYFMPDYPEEPALLELLAEKIAGFSSLVTYNGKAFDIPLLNARFVRMRSPTAGLLAELPHFDLLHPARRLWKQRVGECSLTNLEREILDFEREEDVPGWEIPQIYFQFVSDGQIGSLPTVFLHNQYDIVTLARLAARACQLYREPLGDPSLPGVDLYALARSLEMDGSPTLALEVLEEARLVALDSDTRKRLLRRLSLIYKRQKDWEAAVSIWQELGESDGMLEVFSFEEMAKFYEHIARDLRLAATVTKRILDALSGGAAVDSTPYSDLEAAEAALAHRIHRIERKLARRENPEEP